MKFPVKLQILKTLQTEGLFNPETLGFEYTNSLDSATLQVDPQLFNATLEEDIDLHFLMRIVSVRRLSHPFCKAFNASKRFNADGKKSTVNLITFVEDLKLHFATHAPNRMAFIQASDGSLSPYFVAAIQYFSADEYTPARTCLFLHYIKFEKKTELIVRFYSQDIGKDTIGQCLRNKGVYIETESLMKSYDDELKNYKEFSKYIGKQFNGTGRALVQDRWSKRSILIEKDGKPAKLVLESISAMKEIEQSTYTSYFGSSSSTSTFSSRSNKVTGFWGTGATFNAPVHPYLFMFSLDHDRYMEVHTANITPYAYKGNLASKLILPAETHEILDVIMDTEVSEDGDIIEGKTGGICVLASGNPGVGKTLTAEVVADNLKKALYRVHSSQLGVTPVELEKNLQVILARAQRWNAILSIDEADVYIHQRGEDIVQAAIVGVWLRLIEYYNGILFMTSNRATVVDDAIMSRLTAHIEYEDPTTDELKSIWKVISATMQVTVSEREIAAIVKMFPKTSGRDVKNLLKLAKRYSAKKEVPVTADVISKIAKYKNIKPLKSAK